MRSVIPTTIIIIGMHIIKKYIPIGTSPIKYPVWILCMIIVYSTLNIITENIYIILATHDIDFLQTKGIFTINKYNGCANKYIIANTPNSIFMSIIETTIYNMEGA